MRILADIANEDTEDRSTVGTENSKLSRKIAKELRQSLEGRHCGSAAKVEVAENIEENGYRSLDLAGKNRSESRADLGFVNERDPVDSSRG